MEKLPKEFKDKWIAALRSGKYEQGKSALESNGKFCCLGVACRVVEVETYVVDEMTGQLNELEYIPDNEAIPRFIIGATETAAFLSTMNDGDGIVPPKSFSEISDYIEANL